MASVFSLTRGLPSRASGSSARIGLPFDGVLSAAAAGADWAWTALYRSLAANVLGYLRANGANDPENLLGDVFLQVARNLGTFAGDEDSFRSWVFLIAHHRVVDERRRSRRRPATPVADIPDIPGGSAEDDAMAGLLTSEAKQALDILTPQQREVILLRVFADLSLEDVSGIVGRPVSAVKSLQHRGLERLRKEFSARPYPDHPSWR